jgi:threonine dehydrogenase-like Zn-dependent dehydrogenase
MVGTVVETSGRKFRRGDKVLAVPENQVGLFERFRVSEKRAIPLDPRKPPEVAMMAQPLGTVLFALRKVPQLIDLDVAVVGQGPIGQLFCAALRNLGAREIIALDPVESRLAASPRMGATALVNPARQDAVAEVARLTGGAMADLVIEAVGHQNKAIDLCADLCRPGGRILDFGIPPELMQVAWKKLFWKNLTVHTSIHPDFVRDFPLAMRWISEGRIDVTPLLTHRFPLRDIQKAYETFRDKADGALKVVIDFPAGW